MKVTSKGIINGVILDKYGKRGFQFNEANIPTYSLPLKIEESPQGTMSYAIFLEDKDAVPVCGYSWIHWVVANIIKTELQDNESIRGGNFTQGLNSWNGAITKVAKRLSIGYGGMTPPDAPHIYELHVYALDTMLQLNEGFYMNQLFRKMENHILGQYTLKGIYYN